MFYHADKTRCNTCIEYITHLSTVKNDSNTSLFKALDKLDLYWVKKLENHVEMKRCLDRAFDDGVRIGKHKAIEDCELNGCGTAKEGKDRSSSALDKGKGKASAAENELIELNKKYEALLRTNAALVDDKHQLESENQTLKTQLQLLQNDITSFPLMPQPPPSSRLTWEQDVPMDYGSNPYADTMGISNDPQAGYSGAVKCKPVAATEGSSAKKPKKAPRPFKELRNARTGLPLPQGTHNNPHLPDGPWDRLLTTVPGATSNDKVEYLTQHRYLPLWKEVVAELSAIVHKAGYETLGDLQRKAWGRHTTPQSLLEIACSNPAKVHPSV